MSEIRIVEDGKVVENTPQEIAASPVNDMGFPEGFLDEQAVAQVTGLENDSDKSAHKDDIKAIIKWAKLEGYDTHEGLKWMIRKLQDRLGTPPLTEKWITRLSRYATLALQEQRIKSEQESLLK